MKEFSLGKDSKLKSRRVIEEIFARKMSVAAYPLRLVYLPVEENTPGEAIRAAFSVSKRNFKHAVDRNRVKRLVREAYRLNKHIALDKCGHTRFGFVFIYSSGKLPEYAEVEKKMTRILGQWTPEDKL